MCLRGISGCNNKAQREQEKCLQNLGEQGGTFLHLGGGAVCPKDYKGRLFLKQAMQPILSWGWDGDASGDKEVLSYLSPYRVTTKNILVGHHLKGVCMCLCVFKKARVKTSSTER